MTKPPCEHPMAIELCWFCISLFIFVAVRRSVTGLFSLLKTSSILINQHSSFPLNNFSIKMWSFHTYYDKSSRPVMLQHTSSSISSIHLMKCIYSNFVILFYSDCKPCLSLSFHSQETFSALYSADEGQFKLPLQSDLKLWVTCIQQMWP